jgi:hypothetical protein
MAVCYFSAKTKNKQLFSQRKAHDFMLLSDKEKQKYGLNQFRNSSSSGGTSYRYIPDQLQDAVDVQNQFTNILSGQANSVNDQAGMLNSLSGKYTSTADTINDMAISNLLKYGEVSENDLVGRAATDNALAYGKSYDAAQRNLTRMGINPNSGRFAGMNMDFALTRAAAEAGARNQARIQARNENFARAGTLANVGRNYAGLGLQAAGTATSALGSAANIYNAAAGNADRGTANQGYLFDLENEGRLRQDFADFGGGSYLAGQARYNAMTERMKQQPQSNQQKTILK